MLIRRLTALLLILALAAVSPAAAAAEMPYRITVDCYNNIVTVYSTSDGSVVRQMVCSSGGGKWSSPHGTFTMPEQHKSGERSEWYAFEDGYGKWGTRIVGNYLFHSYLFTQKQDDKVDWEAYAAMGTDASHGCIRLFIEDAKWIAENCFAGTKVKIYDATERYEYLKELLYEHSYSVDSGISYAEFASLASDDTELGYGSEGADVARLQTRLIELGLYAGEADGTYGEGMVRTVKAIQSATGFKATGVASQSLIALLNADDAPCSTISTLEEGMNGSGVKAMQASLASLGLYEGEIDGVYDAETKKAVVLFQRALKYDETGVATGALQADMQKAIAKLAEMYGADNYALTYESTIVESAVIDTENKLNVRKSKSTDSTIVARLAPGTAVEVLSHADSWTKIAFDGQEGYVRTAYLAFEDETIETPKYVQADAEHPALARVDAAQTFIGTREVTYGKVNVQDRLYVRESPSDSAKLSFMLAAGTVVRVITKSDSWAFVSYGGRTGFVRKSYLTTGTVVELSGVVTASGETDVDASDDVYAYVTSENGTPLRAQASNSGAILCEIGAGERASLIFQSTSWSQVRFGDQTGYVFNEDVFVGTVAGIDEYLADLSASKAAFAVVSTGSDARLNMREDASEDAEVARTLENGTVVEVKSDDGTWCEIEYDWKTGYVMSMYVLTIDPDQEAYDAESAGYSDNLIDVNMDEVVDEATSGGN